MKHALVTGADGFIGHHLVARLKSEGYWVRGIGQGNPAIATPFPYPTNDWDSAIKLDLRRPDNCSIALEIPGGGQFDDVYQLAAQMGGQGFMTGNDRDLLHDSALINIHMARAAEKAGAERYFFSSSACVYRNQAIGSPALSEDDAWPASPENRYGFEKLFTEVMLQAYAQEGPMKVRVGRFQNTYGPETTWRGGREKAPAALCRKVAEAKDGGSIEIWGDGSAIRAYTYIDDTIDGIRILMESEETRPTNIGRREYISVRDFAQLVIDISGKKLSIRSVDGPVGVTDRQFTNDRITSLGWSSKVSLREGMTRLYEWVNNQVHQHESKK